MSRLHYGWMELCMGPAVAGLPPPMMIETVDGLRAWAERLAQSGTKVVAFDTESDSFHSYREKVCLIQMTAMGEDVIVDPLAVDDLSAIKPMLEDPEITKIIHDAGYDLLCMRRDFGIRVEGLFDTMWACRLLGERRFGLAHLLRERFGFEANKKLQRSDWGARPLSSAQLDYARFDTHFLPQLIQQLRSELEKKGRWEWAAEDFARMPAQCDARVAARDSVEAEAVPMFWRVKGVKNLSPEAIGRVKALCEARERMAEELDRPRFKVMSDSQMLAFAERPPRSPDDLARRFRMRRFVRDLWQALSAAQPVHEPPPKGTNRRRRSGRFLDPDAKERYETLRNERREQAEGLGLEPEVLLGNAALEAFARQPPEDADAVASHPDVAGWREPYLAGPLARAVAKVVAG